MSLAQKIRSPRRKSTKGRERVWFAATIHDPLIPANAGIQPLSQDFGAAKIKALSLLKGILGPGFRRDERVGTMRRPPGAVEKFAVAAAAFAAMIGLTAASAAETFYLDELISISVGSFTTRTQAERDPRYGVAEAEIVRVWPERTDGRWLYQEQAFLGESARKIDPAMKDKPYFARVIRSVEVSPGVVERSVYKLKAPKKAQGAWKTEAPLAGLSPDDLLPSECGIRVERVAEKMWRAQSEDCPNAYKGATRAVSLGIILDGRYANWDRGFDADGAQVWGPDSGGYIFVKKDGKGN